MGWLSEILAHKNEDGGLQIMYTIHGGKEIDEFELEHLDGHVSLASFLPHPIKSLPFMT